MADKDVKISDFCEEVVPKTLEQLKQKLPSFLSAPKDTGVLRGISVRPSHYIRRLPSRVELSVKNGVSGDLWASGAWLRQDDGTPDPDIQVTLINYDFASYIAEHPDRWMSFGDNLAVDLDLGEENLPIGQQLRIGNAIVEVSKVWHGPCDKFRDRFGQDAIYFTVGSKWRQHRFRGVHAKVVADGQCSVGDQIQKI